MKNIIWSKNLLFLCFGLTAIAGAYSSNISTYVYKYSKSFVPNSFKNGTVNMWNSQFRISSFATSNYPELSDVVVGGENVFLTLRIWLRNLSIFLFDDLFPYIKNHTRREITSHIKHYLKPIKNLFRTSKSPHLINGFNNRIHQLINLFSNPRSYVYLSAMNRFYFEFRNELKKLNDDQLAELVDIFLKNPDEVYSKISSVLKYSEIYPNLKHKFEIETMMDFVRGENLERLKVILLSSSISSKLGNLIFSLSSFFDDDKDVLNKLQNDYEEYVDKRLNSIFLHVFDWLNHESKY